jgi:acetyl-CoA carboxylase biotin carboxyl carrier protein
MAVTRRNRKSEEPASTPSTAMDLSQIKDIIKLMDDHDLSEFELEQEGVKVKLRKGVSAEQAAAALAAAAPAPAPAATAAAPADAIVAEDTEEITAPMVGTFYKASSPETDAFVKVGDAVDEETTVCIIEAMKVMNEIKAEKKGVIQRILAEDAKPVQYGQGLFVIS